MSNVFQHTPVSYFQIPEALIESGKWASLTENGRNLYILLLYYAQKHSLTTIALTAKDAAQVGMGKNAIRDALRSLEAERLVKGSRGSRGYTFELLDPITGNALERINNLSQVDPEIVRTYALDKLGDREYTEHASGLSVNCPFHTEKKARDKNLSFTFDGGGAYNCRSCGAKGGIIDFEIEMAAKEGEIISKTVAHRRVRAEHVSNSIKLAKRKARELAEARVIL
ncbi:MAG TPA: hypothetical protein VGR47_03945 [Terracidiphilus sp.]|nr:hypothetical protein [Terracidiphilus sp.]